MVRFFFMKASVWEWGCLDMTVGFPGNSATQKPGRLPSSGITLHQLPRDDDPLQLVRSLPDREERRVAVIALDVVLLRVAVGAVDPHRFQAVLQGRLGRE